MLAANYEIAKAFFILPSKLTSATSLPTLVAHSGFPHETTADLLFMGWR
jgi:hypothetical protein